jgi:uncharacterized membrane protein
MTPGELSRELRQGSGAFLGQRRAVVGLSLTTMAALGVIVLYQVGIIAHVPEPNLPGFDADKVNGSDQAYELLATPDGILGLGSYTATMALAAMGGQNRAEEQPWIPLALAAKVLVDAAQSTRLTIDQVTKQRALCLWCLVTTAATYATVPLAIPEARAALRTLRGKTA